MKKTLFAVLLVLMSQPLWGWRMPFQGSGEVPGVDENLLDEENLSGSRERPVFVAINNVPLEEVDGSAPLDIDIELEESELEQDAEGMRGPPDTEEDEEEDEEGSGESDRDDSNEIPGSSSTADSEKKYFSNMLYGMLPKVLRNLFTRAPSAMHQFFEKERNSIIRLESELNSIVTKAMNAMIKFNGTTTNSTDVVQDNKGNKFKVETVIKKGDKNQTLIMETIESVPNQVNRTKRSNWLAQHAQEGESIH